MRTRRLAVLMVGALVLAACSDGDDGESAATTPEASEESGPATSAPSTTAPATTVPATTEAPATTAAPETTSPATTEPATTAPATTEAPSTPPAGASEAELAAWALLTLDDLPEGWTSSPDDEDEAENDEQVQSIGECSGLDPALIGDDVLGDTKAKSPEFESPEETATVSHIVGFAPDEETAIAAMTAIGDEALPDCYVQTIEQSLLDSINGVDPTDTMPEGMTLLDIRMDRIPLDDVAEADEAVWYAATVSLDYQGQPLDLYVDLLFLRSGRVLSQLELGGTTVVFPDELIDPVVVTAIQRMDEIAAV